MPLVGKFLDPGRSSRSKNDWAGRRSCGSSDMFFLLRIPLFVPRREAPVASAGRKNFEAMNSPFTSLQRAASHLRSARDLVVFTGAGVSAESGIPTFRDASGLWARFPPLLFATWPGLVATALIAPARLRRFLVAVLEPIVTARPNPAHFAVAELEQHKRVTVITQNIDGLHQRAGSSRVLEVHGSLFATHARGAHRKGPVSVETLERVLRDLKAVPRGFWPLRGVLKAAQPVWGIDRRGLHRPAVVLFGQGLPRSVWAASVEAVDRCDGLLSVGTSGAVFPAAGLPDRARRAGVPVIGVGPDPVPADVWLEGPAGAVLPELVREILT